ncbi:Hpt domain-containing protein [uncultured Nitratireductor sp.]|uniref:Hpt domain-containing protein n=1 Tax=uncultured Nitratireductor sp. TaxID=520953 RepID=UPI0025DA540A|nr:Hpt domain-containing protein [uncultured Nitratireductor sp.]
MRRSTENEFADGAEVSLGASPLDLEHLSRQTLGDETLALEILSMFRQQTEELGGRMHASDLQSRREMAHALVGSARGVGAVELADCAAHIEKMPSDERSITRLTGLIGEVNEFILALLRER